MPCITETKQETASLIDRLKARDPRALASIYDSYGRLAYHIIFRLVLNHSIAEDLTQEAFLRIWNGAPSFDPSRGALKTWIVAVARNCALDHLRSAPARASRDSVSLDSARSHAAQSQPVELSAFVRQALTRLPADERLVLDLCYTAGMTHTEIAASLDRPLGTIKTWVRRALANMRTQLEPHEAC